MSIAGHAHADPRGRQGSASTLSVQFLSFSCSFQQKSRQIIGFHPTLRGLCPLENPGSTTIPKFGGRGVKPIYFLNFLKYPMNLKKMFSFGEQPVLVNSNLNLMIDQCPIGGSRISLRGTRTPGGAPIIFQNFTKSFMNMKEIGPRLGPS